MKAVPNSVLDLIDEIADRMEQDWCRGQKRPAESYLQEVDQQYRPTLLRELLVAELQLRRRDGHPLTMEELKSRFAAFPGLVAEVAAELSLPSQADVESSRIADTVDGTVAAAANPLVTQTVTVTSPTAKTRQLESRARYSILAEHGKGGLGVVYRAVDEQLSREVAVKEIQRKHADDSAGRLRFIFEAKVTGALEHPGIVPVYGLGSYGKGQPYYAMRFIRGQSLDEAIKDFYGPDPSEQDPTERELQFRTLLRHFIDVCNSVHYAHTRGVLHRDLKPANVMLGNHGETLVVDWGLAKLLPSAEQPTGVLGEMSERPELSSGNQTSHGSVVGTPQYMSPEQASGGHDELGPTTDVYSLGAMLFSLLTGHHSVRGTSAQELLVKVIHGDIRTAREANPLLPRPLEAICQKAMRRESQHRYPSPRELARDIERWLADEAVSAYRDQESHVERAGRWMRKHRSWTRAIAASLLVMTLVSSAAAIAIDRARKREIAAKGQALLARQQAVDRFRDSRSAIDTWLTGASDALQYVPGAQGIRQRLLEKAVQDYERLAQTRSDDHDVELERARTQLRLGDLHLQQLEHETAEKWYRGAQSLFEELHAQFPDSLDAPLGIANARAKLGWLFTVALRHSDASDEFDEAILQLRELCESHPRQSRCQDLLSSALLNYGHGLAQAGRLDESDHALREAVALFERLEDLSSAVPRYPVGRATALELLGRNQAKRGGHVRAIAQLDKAIAVLAPHVSQRPDEPDCLDAQSEAYLSLAASQRALGRFQDAKQSLRQAIDNYEALAQAIPDTPRYPESLALTHTDMGILLHDMGSSADAATELSRGRDLFESLLLTYGSHPGFHKGLGACEDALGQSLADLSEGTDQAQTLLSQAVVRFSELAAVYAGENEFIHRLALARSHYGQVLHKMGNSQQAARELMEARRLLEELVELKSEVLEYQEGLAHVHNRIGILQGELGRANAARESFRHAIRCWEQLVDDQPTARHLKELALLLANCRDQATRSPELAIELARQAKRAAPDNPVYLHTLAVAHYRHGEFNQCVDLMNEAARLRPGGTAHDFFFLAMAQHQLKRYGEARESFGKGVQWMDVNQPENAELQRVQAEAANLVQVQQSGADD